MPMELLDLLMQRLEFAKYFYSISVYPFHETKRKINQEEEPYIDLRDPEYAYEPAFLREYESADLAAELVGVSTIAFVQSVFHAYLERMVRALGGDNLLAHVSKMGQKSWLQNYRELFRRCKIDWTVAGVDLDFLEQSILTRNDFMHNVDLLSAYVFQGETHTKKHPESAFRDPSWGPDIARITVTDAALQSTIDAVLILTARIEKSMP